MTTDLYRTILEVIRDGSRTDRYLTLDGDGVVFLTTKDESVEQVCVPPSLDRTEEEEEEFAAEIAHSASCPLDDLDDIVRLMSGADN